MSGMNGAIMAVLNGRRKGKQMERDKTDLVVESLSDKTSYTDGFIVMCYTRFTAILRELRINLITAIQRIGWCSKLNVLNRCSMETVLEAVNTIGHSTKRRAI